MKKYMNLPEEYLAVSKRLFVGGVSASKNQKIAVFL